MADLNNILNQYEPISLGEMDEVKLLNRVDTKYILSKQDLLSLLPALMSDYRPLEVNGVRNSGYRTLYYDTPEHLLYLQHHNGRLNRFKIRYRKYLESDLCFLEIKKKIKGRTVKERIKIADFELAFSSSSKTFVEEAVETDVSAFIPSMWNSFKRITLVNRNHPERLTLDNELTFEMNGEQHKMDNLIIAELKQGKLNRDSKFVQVMKERRLRPMRVSKYCVGTILLNRDLKYNRFKEKLININKITNGSAA